jgi:hypothetical protein
MTSTAVPTTTFPIMDHPIEGTTNMLIEEALARSRMREAQQAAHNFRTARQLTAGRTWQRLARWTARRAERARAHL